MRAFDTLSRRGQLIRLGRLARAALEHYALPGFRLMPMKHEHNTTFRVSTVGGERYALRVHRPGQHTPDAIRSELLWLTALHHDTTLDVPQPVRTIEGAFLTVAEAEGVPEPRVCVLFRWLAGRFVNERLTPSHLRQVGRFTARLHQHARQWTPPADFVRGRVDNLTAEARRISRVGRHNDTIGTLEKHPTDADVEQTLHLVGTLCSTQDAALVARAIEQIEQVLQRLGYGPDNFGLIHADLHQENYFFRGDRVCAIDFDDCGFGHHLFDLNVTLLEVSYLPQYPALREALLAGYREVLPLREAHEAYLDTFFALRRLQLLVWVLESREHPAFRHEWQEWAQDELQELKHLLEKVA